MWWLDRLVGFMNTRALHYIDQRRDTTKCRIQVSLGRGLLSHILTTRVFGSS